MGSDTPDKVASLDWWGVNKKLCPGGECPVPGVHMIAFKDFERWARGRVDDGEDLSYRDLAGLLGCDPQYLANRKLAGTVPIHLVRDFARGTGRSPLRAVEEWVDLALLYGQPRPSSREWVTQLEPVDLQMEVARRFTGMVPRRWKTDQDSAYGREWVGALLDGPLGAPAAERRSRRKQAASALGMQYATLKAKESRGVWSMPELAGLCRWSGWSLRLGLAATGWFTWGEVGLNPRLRYTAPWKMDAEELVCLLEAQRDAVYEALREEQVVRSEGGIWSRA